ncbi:Arginine kinase [Amphibalanus amphitrite]|uniref:Arginine kinase n=1 Tax=Amphibalanus amphitrite TaxID=1232801 RepID=A0A6A4XDQ3_AMPAM|nr:Arginine kinase [Amphibalanus amphitrite]
MVDAATLEKLEAGFQKLQAATDCKSLLKKYLTKEVFDSLKTKKTSFGSTLLDVIQSEARRKLCRCVIELERGDFSLKRDDLSLKGGGANGS